MPGPEAPIEELDAWILAIGGKELTQKEFEELIAEVHWADVPGERIDAKRGIVATDESIRE